MVKMTREEKRMAEQVERERKQALEFKAAVERERSRLVLDGDSDVKALEQVRQRSGFALASALCAALSEVRRLRHEVATKTRWVADNVREMERALVENRFYSSTVFQNVDDLQQTYGQFYQAACCSAWLANALDCYVPMLQPAADVEKRARLITFSVVPVPAGLDAAGIDEAGKWLAFVNGERAVYGDELSPAYDEEWLAWRALSTLANS